MDGVRQDFIVEQAPPSPPGGELVVKLAVAGAQVEPAADGARLVLTHSGRKIAYSRLRVTDATGKELPARMELASGILPDVEGAHPAARNSGADYSWAALRNTPESAGLEAPALRQAGMPAATSLAVVVNDTEAVYPVRIDPTFSDANWVGMGGFPGANGPVHTAVTDGSGNLYIGAYFTTAGNALANSVAQWNGSSWSALGSGMNNAVYALAVSGSTLYAGGLFTTAGTNFSANAALAYLPGSLVIITTNAAFGFTDGVFGFDVSCPSGSNVVIQASTDLQTWIPLQTNLLGSGPLHFSDAQSSANPRRFYRAQLSP
jgi:hypothetical protein